MNYKNDTEMLKDMLAIIDFEVWYGSGAKTDEEVKELIETHGDVPFYRLVDLQLANLGGIEQDTFIDTPSLVDRLDIYWQDSFYADIEDYDKNGESIYIKLLEDHDRIAAIKIEDLVADHMAEMRKVFEDYLKSNPPPT